MTERVGLEAVLEDANFQRGLTNYIAGLGTMDSKTSSTASGLTTGFTNMGKSVLAFGATVATAMAAAGAAITVGLGKVIADGVDDAKNMEAQISGIAAVLNKSADEVAPLADLILDLGVDPRLKVSAEEAADAIELLARNGLGMTEILDGAAFNTVLLANSTGTDFANAANIATDAMAIFNIEAKDMGIAVDGITSVTTSSKFSIDDYALALANGGGVAKSAGVPFDEFNTTISAISPAFASGMTAGTAFKNLLLRLSPKTNTAKDAMRELGLITEEGSSVFYDAAGNLKGMDEVAQILQDTFIGLSEEERTLAMGTIFGNDAMGAAIGLMNLGADTGEGAAAAFRELAGAMGETSAVDSAATRMDNLAGAMEILKGIIDTVKLQIGNEFLPIVRQVVEAITAWVTDNMDDIKGFFAAIAEGVSIAVEAIPSLIGYFRAVVEDGDTLNDFLANLPKSIQPFVKGLGDLIVKVSEFVNEHSAQLIGAIKGIAAVLGGSAIVAAISMIGSLLASILSPIGLIIIAAAALGAAWETNFMGIRDILTNAWETTIRPALEELWTWLSVNVPIAIETLRAFWVDTLWPAIQQAIEIVWPIIQAIFQAYVFYVIDIFIPALQALWDYWVNVLWPAIQNAIEVAWPVILQIWSTLVTWVTETLIPTLQELWTQWVTVIWPAIVQAVTDAWAFIQPILVAIGTFILETLIPTIQNLWDTWVNVVWPAIQTVTSEVWTFVSGIFEEIGRWINDNIVPWLVFLGDKWNEIWLAIFNKIFEVWGQIQPIFITLENWMKDTLVLAINTVRDAFKGSMDSINSSIESVKSPLDGLITAVKDFGNWLRNNVFDFEFHIPDLPDWALPGSPLPIHTAWKDFSGFMDREMTRQMGGGVVPLPVPAPMGASPVTVQGGSTVNEQIYNLNLQTAQSDLSVSNAFKLMEMTARV